MNESRGELPIRYLPKSKFSCWLTYLVTICFVWFGEVRLPAAPALDTSSPLNFFSGTANLLLQNAGYNFTVTNIPLYPTNYYTPALHRLLQLAANLYDATTNRAFSDGSSPNGPFYPSVFRPTFNRVGSNVFIAGYVEEGDGTTSYNAIPLSLPEDFASVGATTTNIYGIPWVIGVRKGFPNFNEFSMASVAQITRKIEVVNLTPGSSPPTFQTNVQYIIGISNVLGVEAWNSYSNSYPRAIDLFGVDNLSLSLTNELGVLYSADGKGVNGKAWFYSLGSNAWAGAVLNSVHQYNTNSFFVPLFTNSIFLPDSVYHATSTPHLGNATNFDAGAANVIPHFVLSFTNTLRFIMVDHLTGRVIDYVHLNRMNFTRDLAAELQGTDNGGNGGVWLTNLLQGQVIGIDNQISISEGIPVGGFIQSDWINDTLPGNAVTQNAVIAFEYFINGQGGLTNAMQAPFTPTRKIAVYYTWQANDPLIHYMLSDLTPQLPVQSNATTNYLSPAFNTNQYLPNLGQINTRFLPWFNTGNPKGGRADTVNASNLAVKDSLITRSDNWNFPSGQPLTLQTIGNVHRGTPWQTVYLKSTPVALANWQTWTGDTLTNQPNLADASLSLPTNDWSIAALLLPLLAPQDPHLLYGFNQPDPNVFTSALSGLTVLTNTPTGLLPLTIDANINSNAISQIIAGINAQRLFYPDHLFPGIAPLFAVPQLSTASPFLNITPNAALTDAAYESLSAQLLPLLRPDPIGSMINTGGVTQWQFTGLDGYAYMVQASTNLQDWTPVATEYPTNGSFVFSDADAGNFTRRYYRSVLAP